MVCPCCPHPDAKEVSASPYLVGEESVCEFCDKAKADPASRSWYDYHILGAIGSAHIVAALGPLRVGHLMLVPNDHYLSMAEYARRNSDFADTVSKLMQVVSTIWPRRSSPLIFEHGATQAGRASCIEHAHLQIVPGLGHLASGILPLDWVEVVAYQAISSNSEAGYLSTFDGKQLRVAAAAALPNQYLRRRVREIQGRPDEWDYLMYPELTRVEQTVVDVKAYAHEAQSLGIVMQNGVLRQ